METYPNTSNASTLSLGVAGIKYAYALELRDTGSYGFLLPVGQIKATNEETLEGLRTMVALLEKEF